MSEVSIINEEKNYFIVPDTTAPVITLVGNHTIIHDLEAIYTDAGATAFDNVDGNITTSISVVNTVNTAIVGQYTVTYNVSDAAGNAAVPVTRTVNVVDTTVPVITLEGDAVVTIEVDAIYTDAGATAFDNVDGNITTSISVVNTVNTAIVGQYTVTYNVSDAAGNAAVEVTRTVTVQDTTAPVITLTGDASITLEVGATYSEEGATVTDNYDSNLTVVVGGDTVDTTTVGTYTVTYNVSDAAGNAATEVTRTVIVEPTLSIPEIDDKEMISIYPNPVKEYIIINSSEKTSTQIFDINGKLIRTTYEKKTDLSDLESGVYLLRIIMQSGRVHHKKIIKE